MSLFIEYHLIQNFAPSNLNRDDTGSPKEALFGGHRRARISSQCSKKRIRDWFRCGDLLADNVIGIRTRRLDSLLSSDLKEIGLSDVSLFNEIVKQALKKKASKEGREEKENQEEKEDNESDEKFLSYLMFISMPEIEEIKNILRNEKHKEEILNLASKKKIKPTDISAPLKADIKKCFSRSRAVDIALFGRMLADLPEANQDAACQVAHAISTHRVEREFDFFTAVDDKSGSDETGAAMIGQVEFNSATFYRYAVVDVHKLMSNLRGNNESSQEALEGNLQGNDESSQKILKLCLSTLEAFTQAMVRAIPSGKQNSFAAHNPPAFIGVCLRHGCPLNLANAFETPVTARMDSSLTEQSVDRLVKYKEKLEPIYGNKEDAWVYIDASESWADSKGKSVNSLDDLAAWVREEIGKQLKSKEVDKQPKPLEA